MITEIFADKEISEKSRHPRHLCSISFLNVTHT